MTRGVRLGFLLACGFRGLRLGGRVAVVGPAAWGLHGLWSWRSSGQTGWVRARRTRGGVEWWGRVAGCSVEYPFAAAAGRAGVLPRFPRMCDWRREGDPGSSVVSASAAAGRIAAAESGLVTGCPASFRRRLAGSGCPRAGEPGQPVSDSGRPSAEGDAASPSDETRSARGPRGSRSGDDTTLAEGWSR